MKKAIFAIAGVIAFYYVASLIMNFMDISVSSYLPYLLWLVALVILYVVLPKSRDIFAVEKVVSSE
tara:strand:- start:1458 stop:1655 length:198 start_codon:yes stop_codon:yes gene_type:complete